MLWALGKGTWRRPDPALLFAFSCFFTSLAHLTGLLPQGGKVNNVFLYASMPHVTKAAYLFLFGSVGIWLGMQVLGSKKWRLPFAGLGAGGADWNPFGVAALGLGAFGLRFGLPASFGLIGDFLENTLPLGVVFYLARRSEIKQEAVSWWLAFLLTVAFTVYQVLFAYLRMEMVLPSVVFMLGVLTTGRFHFRGLFRPRYAAILVWVVLFILAFPWMKNNRGKYGAGKERIAYIQKSGLKEVFTDYSLGETVLTRGAVLNQLSHVVRMTEEEGFYKGKTLAYWRYIFIPRILWPGKPEVATGAWFAHKTEELDEGKRPYPGYNTWSANMTIPGELYLNFGWPGLLLGCMLFGMFVQILWNQAAIYSTTSPPPLIRHVLALFLLLSALFQFGADMEYVVNIAATGGICLGISALGWRKGSTFNDLEL